jgi:hypothetical protein
LAGREEGSGYEKNASWSINNLWDTDFEQKAKAEIYIENEEKVQKESAW